MRRVASIRRWRLPVKTLIALLMVVGLMGSATFLPANAAQQLDPDVRDRVTAAAVQVAIDAWFTEADGDDGPAPITVGSGTIVSPDGLVITNAHVVDEATRREVFNDYRSHWLEEYPTDDLEFYPDTMLLLASDGFRPPRLAYQAEILEVDVRSDIAILRIIDSVDPAPYPFVPMGDSNDLRLGDPIFIFGYPMSGGDALTFTTGVVSGFNFANPSDDYPIWINSDAVMSGGNSGGTAVNDRGELIGIPTEGASLDCRPGDTNGDGEFTSEDVGCIPTGGSIGRLRPVNIAADVMERAGRRRIAQVAPTATTAPPTPTPVPPTSTPVNPWNYYVDSFDGPLVTLKDEGRSRVTTGNGEFHISLGQSDKVDTWYYTDMPAQYGDYFIRVDIASTSGSGSVFVAVQSPGSSQEWIFSVETDAHTWSLWRLNNQDTDYFYWINPRDLGNRVYGPIDSIEVQIIDNIPHLLVNDVDVSALSGLEMPEMAQPRKYGFGSTSWGAQYDVRFSEVTIGRLR